MINDEDFLDLYEGFSSRDYSIRDQFKNSSTSLVAKYLQEILNSVSITPDQISLATKTYEEVCQVLESDPQLNRCASFDFYPQGSLSHQTTIKSGTRNVFDLDIVARTREEGTPSLSPLELLDQVQHVLSSHEKYRGHVEEKNRCVKLNLPGSPFTMDITPGKPAEVPSLNLLKKSDPIWVGDRKNNRENNRKISDPQGFASWVDQHAEIRPSFAIPTQETRITADAEKIPEQQIEQFDVLRQLIKLLKLHRNVYYRRADNVERKPDAPISIIITTLTVKAFAQISQSNTFEDPIKMMLAIVDAIPNQIARYRGNFHIDNPSVKGENFADKWNDARYGLSKRKEFGTWYLDMKSSLNSLLTAKDADEIKSLAEEAFGSYAISAAKNVEGVGKLGGIGLLERFASSEPEATVEAPHISPHA